jgi:hypothetical protein
MRPDIVITDISMPVTSGWETICHQEVTNGREADGQHLSQRRLDGLRRSRTVGQSRIECSTSRLSWRSNTMLARVKAVPATRTARPGGMPPADFHAP